MLKKIKLTLLKIIDLTALGFLEPVVRLCYGEEPKVQLKKIGQYVVVPMMAFAVFIGLWAFIAPKHKTKSGEVPTPAVVWDAYDSIMTFHDREGRKEWGYLQSGLSREEALAKAQARLEELNPLRTEAEAAVAAAEADKKAMLAEDYDPIMARYEKMKQEARDASKARDAALKAQAEAIAPGDADAKRALLAAVAEHQAAGDAEKAASNAVKVEAEAILKAKYPKLNAAQKKLTAVAEEAQFLGKLIEKLGQDNRELKIADFQARADQARAAYEAGSGAELVKLAGRVISAQELLGKVAESTYAKPWTLPMQVIRSVYCVFVGFFLGSAIAIPIGVLCGLSRTFMAAMTPFIALFKPVSPIVWLPICLIIIGGFFDNPDDHWFFKTLWDLPIIGWLKINPAFLASACTVALCSLWATMTNTALGVASVDKDHLNVARVLRLGFWPRLFKIVLPSALPLVFAGLRISLGIGWMVLIAAELLSTSEGIGKFVWDQFSNGASDSFAKMMVVVFVVGFVGLILDRIMIIFQRMVSFEGSVAAV